MDPSKRGRLRKDALDRLQKAQERMARHIQGERISELYALTEKELAEKHDALVEEAATTNARQLEQKARILERAQVYADELARRTTAEQGERMEALTRETVRQGERLEALTTSLNRLTWVIMGATIIGVLLTAWAILSGA